MKNILFLSYDGLTDPLGQSQIIPYLAGLTQFGYRFTIISCDKPNRYEKYNQQIKEILKPYPIKWVSIPYHKNPPVLSSIYDVIVMKQKVSALHARDKFDMVHTRAGTPALVGLWMKKKYGVKFLNDLRDFFADSRLDSGSWKSNNPVYRKVYQYFKGKEEEAIEKNDGIVCLTQAAEKIIRQWPQFKPGLPLQVIPCSVDMDLFNPGSIDPNTKKTFARGLGIREKDIIFSYLGSIGGWYLTHEILQCCKILSDAIPTAKFLFISPHGHETIVEKAKQLGLAEEKLILKQADRSEVPLLLSLSSYSLFFIKPCYSKQASSPTKHGEIMAMGIPLITNSGVGDVAEIVQQYQSGMVLNHLTEEAYINLAEALLNKTSFNSQAIRAGAMEYFNLKTAIDKYHLLYEAILEA